MLYAANPDWTIADLHRSDQRFQLVSIGTLRTWARDDEWEKLRVIQNEKFLGRLRRQFGDALYAHRTQEIKTLEVQKRQMDHMVATVAAKPKSLEGLAKASLEIGKRLESLMESVGQQTTTTSDDPLAGIQLDDDDREALAEFLIERRRKKADEVRQLTATVQPPTPDEDEDE